MTVVAISVRVKGMAGRGRRMCARAMEEVERMRPDSGKGY